MKTYIVDDFNKSFRDGIKVNIPPENYSYYYAIVRYFTDDKFLLNKDITIYFNSIDVKIYYDKGINIDVDVYLLKHFFLDGNILYIIYDEDKMLFFKRKCKIKKIRNRNIL